MNKKIANILFTALTLTFILLSVVSMLALELGALSSTGEIMELVSIFRFLCVVLIIIYILKSLNTIDKTKGKWNYTRRRVVSAYANSYMLFNMILFTFLSVNFGLNTTTLLAVSYREIYWLSLLIGVIAFIYQIKRDLKKIKSLPILIVKKDKVKKEKKSQEVKV